jgi:riboflavin synthase
MFTGIVTEIGTLLESRPADGGRDLEISCSWTDLVEGESIAVDGACLTVARLRQGGFAVHVIRTSLDRTRFAGLQRGARVNLERALRVGDRLAGHLVQGHVDGVGVVLRVTTPGDARLL